VELGGLELGVGGNAPSSGRRAEERGSPRLQFVIALAFAGAWTMFSVWVSRPWLSDLGNLTHPVSALVALTFIAYLPGFMNAFLLFSLLVEPRRKRRRLLRYPGISVLIAAYQEEEAIARTLQSVRDAGYQGNIEIIVLDDGSADGTSAAVDHCRTALFSASPAIELRLIRFERNRGKAMALNAGLEQARHELVVTIDADTHLHPGSLAAIVDRLLSDPPGTVAVAGAVLVGNAGESLIAGAQQWDYFHGIAAVKRMQSMYGGTLVAQGAFSIYRRRALLDAGGWPDTVGEDIVLTWALLARATASATPRARSPGRTRRRPSGELARQRKRWARGMIEALSHHKPLLFKRRLSTMFIWWNLLFISLDLAFTLVFVPALVLAFFGFYWLAGPITLLVLPLAALWNLVIFRIQMRMLRRAGIEMKRSLAGFAAFVVAIRC
jgi:biofilm PGA synthesis N-glycosyltransferase PgaC